ncbi:hypothetical protein LOK49_LG12G02966 [Camellia lanceoleosa]|uniref:Uncharacterized protein n=1 Tax=Camellia lanceoleosa TaxID=1840588 RepID=A0ACC0FWL2_9ERIC|nr:hypothetical protein LOK49_LG12G02966 [Camellia lanceoleosa]
MVNSHNLTGDDAGSIVGEKRPAENGEDVELGVPLPKKARNGGGLVGNVKKVEEGFSLSILEREREREREREILTKTFQRAIVGSGYELNRK